ncbi:ABC transporter permease [bacterium]|nr:ABC transporter permease [bacterium]
MIELLASSLRLSTPLLFAAMGGLLCERAGIATICLEGVMIMGAWAAASVAFGVSDPYIGLCMGILAGMLTMAIHCWLCVNAKADAIVSGVAVNMLAAGVTPLLTKAFFQSPTNTPSLAMEDRFGAVAVPGLEALPVVGPLFNQPWMIYLALVLPFALHYFFYSTGRGLRVLASGDNPEALETAGISPRSVRWKALLWGGALTALGGVYLSTAHASQFTRDMTAGRGFIALTAVIFGKWRPLPTLGACLFFGFFDALQIRLQSETIQGWEVPVQLVQSMPYLVALIVLAGFIGKARPPLAIGK